MKPNQVTRTDTVFLPDPSRVITKPYMPGEEAFPDGLSRIQRVVERILAMTDEDVTTTLEGVHEAFADRHLTLPRALEESFATVEHRIENPGAMSPERQMLVGSYFTHEYTIEAAALTNPSIVPAPDQTGLEPGEIRFILSFRAIGEGHISSIEFRSGTIDSDSKIRIDEPIRHTSKSVRRATLYEKRSFSGKLEELGVLNKLAREILDVLPDQFTMEHLEEGLRHPDWESQSQPSNAQTARTIHWLASSNYETSFDPATNISDRVIFPAGPTESHGMEDARFVMFSNDDGSVAYYATYTAFDGFNILPQLIETKDFVSFRISTLNGPSAKNKGMALFPRKIDGRYAALSRNDNENNFLMLSDHIRFWDETQKIQVPERPWEIMQVGNCGSPLETEAGWLVITHGVGPMRQYSLGAILLDIDDPRRVLGHLKDPLLSPTEEERNGYVPNVVYSCGSMIHNEQLILPYGFSDFASRIALFPVADVLTRLTEK